MANNYLKKAQMKMQEEKKNEWIISLPRVGVIGHPHLTEAELANLFAVYGCSND